MALEPKEYVDVLSHSQLFHGIAREDLQDLMEHGKVVQFPERGIVVEESAQVPGLNVILEGFVQVIKNGQTQVTQLGQGNFFGEITLFSIPYGASASIISPQGCTCFVINKTELGGWLKKNPENALVFFRRLSMELCNRLYSTTAKLTEP